MDKKRPDRTFLFGAVLFCGKSEDYSFMKP